MSSCLPPLQRYFTFTFSAVSLSVRRGFTPELSVTLLFESALPELHSALYLLAHLLYPIFAFSPLFSDGVLKPAPAILLQLRIIGFEFEFNESSTFPPLLADEADDVDDLGALMFE